METLRAGAEETTLWTVERKLSSGENTVFVKTVRFIVETSTFISYGHW